MKSYKVTLVFCVLSALSIGYWIAQGEFQNTVELNNLTVSPKDAAEDNGLARLPVGSPSDQNTTKSNAPTDKLSKIKALIDKQRSERSELPWEKTDAASEQMSRQLWESKRTEYLNLLNTWDLTPSEIAAVENLILEREINLRKISNKEQKTKVSSPESKLLKSDAEKLKSETDSKISAIAGEAKLNELRRWEDSKRERKTVEKVSSLLEKGSPLTPNQEQVLLDVLYSEREKNSNQGKSVDSLFLQAEGYRKTVISKLGSTLNQDQLAALDDILKRENARWQRSK